MNQAALLETCVEIGHLWAWDETGSLYFWIMDLFIFKSIFKVVKTRTVFQKLFKERSYLILTCRLISYPFIKYLMPNLSWLLYQKTNHCKSRMELECHGLWSMLQRVVLASKYLSVLTSSGKGPQQWWFYKELMNQNNNVCFRCLLD